MKNKKCYGAFCNVKLTDEEYEKLKVRFPDDYNERIDDLSYYIDSKGDKYKNHYSTILLWERRDKKRGIGNNPSSVACGATFPSRGRQGTPAVKKTGFNNFNNTSLRPEMYEEVKKRSLERLMRKWGED